MAVTWTEDQRRVIDTRKKNILVSAAAGSGKTAVLSQRILSLIMDPEDPGRYRRASGGNLHPGGCR